MVIFKWRRGSAGVKGAIQQGRETNHMTQPTGQLRETSDMLQLPRTMNMKQQQQNPNASTLKTIYMNFFSQSSPRTIYDLKNFNSQDNLCETNDTHVNSKDNLYDFLFFLTPRTIYMIFFLNQLPGQFI